jgi:hypothetical protein
VQTHQNDAFSDYTLPGAKLQLAFAGKVGKIQLVYWVGSEGRLAGTPGTNAAQGPFPTDYLSPVMAGMAREDGYQIEDLTVQGMRSYDPDTAQWTSPDVYARRT